MNQPSYPAGPGGPIPPGPAPANPYGYGPPKPGKVQAIAIMQLGGGIWALLHGIGVAVSTLFLYVPWIFAVALGIMAILRGSKLLGDQAYGAGNPKTVAVMQIINIINGDVVNLVLGVLCLVFQNEPEVRRYLEPGYPGGHVHPGGQPHGSGEPVVTGQQYPTVRR